MKTILFGTKIVMLEARVIRMNKLKKIAIVGLGYVGLPLAIEFSKIKTCLRTGKN